ncbi:MAG: 1-deoxy-D-xylulose-5-phosphate synthase [Clostridia bacterium]|nr:1-deoxy-D-xylulose-5-phosphate synthase [Clostridia bacterium]
MNCPKRIGGKTVLENVHSPDVLKVLTLEELASLAGEIREKIIDAVSKNGGHLASNLGIVEVTLALHKVFNAPSDQFLFDVGHQSYAHKLVTGRVEDFHTLRQKDGVSGFEKRGESEYDVMCEGHSGASLSQALGLAAANKFKGSEAYTVCVIGDGSLTNGMIYEALNNCADKDLRLLIVVNDNDMSISANIGGMHNHLTKLRTSKRYFSFKYRVERVVKKIPLIGKPIEKSLRGFKRFLKNLFVRNTLFEDMGVKYYGPMDGHNLKKLVNIFNEAKSHNKIAVVNVKTQKGKGYLFAEKEPEIYHSVAPFDREKGVLPSDSLNFTRAAGNLLLERAETDPKICALTAAMCDGTGLTEFSEKFPDRFFDVGIAEEHAVAFSGGLAANGMKPVLVLYSTFAQRVCDQLLHDVSLQKLPLTLLLDHCGFVEGDGITHQGIFDVPLFTAIPNTEIYAPETYQELSSALDQSLASDKISIVRYPKGEELSREGEETEEEDFAYTPEIENAEIVIVTYGRVSAVARGAAAILNEKRKTGVLRLKKIFPLDFEKIKPLIKSAKLVYFLEEGSKAGGIGEKFAAGLAGKDVTVHAIEGFAGQGTKKELFEEYGFTPEKIIEEIERRS